MTEVTDLAMEMIIAFDEEGKVLSCNRAAREELGYGEGLAGLFLTDIFAAENPQDTPFVPVSQGGQKEIADMVAYRKNSTCFPVLLRILWLEKEAASQEDCVSGFVMAWNLSQQKALEKEVLFLKSEAEETRKVRNEFVANVTHELRTPVNGVKGHTFALLAASPTREQKKTLEIIQRCCDDMSSIINNILDFSKLSAGKFELSHVRFDLYELLDYVIAANIAVINEKGLRIFLNVSNHVPRFVFGDDLRLKQILNNLISNGVKFTDIGFLSIDVNKHIQYGEESELFFVVRDTGIGISPEDKDRLFQSFSQVDTSPTRRHGGTGLGLVIVKELVELMGGSIQVESQKGKGSSFSFMIRLKTEETPGTASDFPAKAASGERAWEPMEIASFYRFGSEENRNEISKKTQTLILALELEAWEKAELIGANLKKLVQGGPEDLKKALFRLEMAIRKEDVPGSRERFDYFREQLRFFHLESK